METEVGEGWRNAQLAEVEVEARDGVQLDPLSFPFHTFVILY